MPREQFATGIHAMQSAGGKGVASWIRRRAEEGKETEVRDEDIIVWCAFGTRITRVRRTGRSCPVRRWWSF